MKIQAHLQNSLDRHEVALQTNDHRHDLVIAPKASGRGSSVNGGELLLLALATCYCNDIYREAAKRGIVVERLEVVVEGDFPAEGAPATNLTYQATVAAYAGEADIRSLMRETDHVAEIQNTVRAATPVRLSQIKVIPLDPG